MHFAPLGRRQWFLFPHFLKTIIPRVYHWIELICHVAYLVLLAHYLLNPPNKPIIWDNHFAWRELLLICTPLSLVHRPYTILNALPLFVSLAFLIGFTLVPLPGSVSFIILLWIFVLHILRLHIPISPSPLFLFSHHRSLPLAAFLSHGLFRMIFPAVVFFLPGLLVASSLISFSLADWFSKGFVHPLHIPSPSPMATRLTFLYLFAVILILLISSFFLLATTLFSPHQKSADPWDRYSPEVGHMARMALVDAIVPCAGLYKFPPPFNILHLLLIRIPRNGALLLGIKAAWGGVAEKALWRVIVGPFVVVSTVLHWAPLKWIRYGRVTR